ncbi:MAG: type and secretion system protein [Verrucomicrobia bacterium]|nr:type and secretion system protein [Verrucomicrobiota bacterium]
MSLRLFRLRLAALFLFAACGAMAQSPAPNPPSSAQGPQPGPPPPPGTVPDFGPSGPANVPGGPELVSPPAPRPATPATVVLPKPSPNGGSEELVGPIKLADADIDTVLGALEIYTGRTILRPQTLPTASTYTLKLNKAVPKSEAITALETLLALNGVGLSPLGERFLKVIPLAQVKTEAPEIIDGSTLNLAPSGRIATKLFQLEFLRVNEFVPQIAPLMSPGVANGIVSLDKANAALITDSVSNLQRVEMLLRQLDRPMANGLSPKFYTLRGGSKASDMVNKLRSLFQGPLQTQLGTATTYSADDRTNQIILLADPRQYPIFDDLIAKLDTVAEPNTRNEVIYLKHAAAKDVATLLSQLVSGQNSSAQKSSGGATVRPLLPNANPQPGQVNGVTTPAPAPAVAGLADQTNEFSTLITVLPDERSNAVIVSGTVDDIRLIRDLVDKLDIVLAQVRIEVIIAEVTLSDSDKSGISALNLTVGPGADNRTMITNFSADAGSAGSGIAGWNISGGVVNPLSFNAALGNTGSRHNVRVLQSPTIVTTHNKEASVVVSQQQPVITGTQTNVATGTSSPVSSSQVTYKDIGINLKVTPLIGDDGSIQLKIDQVVDDVIGNVTIDGNQQPIIGHREANSFVNVNDGQMIVLGGLQRNALTRDRTKLGFFYEIPILSQLLGGRSHGIDRTELLLFIRPHVLRPEESTGDTTQKINDLSNKDQVFQYLSDPTKQPKEKFIEKLK